MEADRKKMEIGNVEITPVKYGESVLGEDQIFENGDSDKFDPIVFIIYLIKTGKKQILVDAGCETMPGFDMKAFVGPIKALAEKGISPDDITDVIITHAHHDHIACVKYFKNAVIHIQKEEYEAGKDYFTPDLHVRIFEDHVILYENIKVLKIGGHTKGSCIVEVKDGEESYIIAGDECYSRKCIEQKIPTGSSYCPEKSRRFIENYGNGHYKILLCHEE